MLECCPRAGWVGEGDRRTAPGEPRVSFDDVVEKLAREADGNVPEREERPRGVLERHRPAPRLDELDEPVSRVEGELHRPS